MQLTVRLGSHFGPWSFYKQALTIALPVMLQQFIMSMVSLIDNFMIAGLGDINMAAVNVTNQINFIFMVIVNTICQAGGIYLAQFRGAQDNAGMQNAFRFKVIFGIIAAALYFTLCQTIPHRLLAMMTMGNAAQEDIIAVGANYCRLVSWTVFPFSISTAVATSFREIAKPKAPLVISAIATVLNTFGNWIFIYGNLGAPRLEVTGAAYTTIAARIIEGIVYVSFASSVKAPFFVGITRLFHIGRGIISRILSRSAMIFVSELSWVGSETIMTAMYNRRGGAEIVAGMAAGWTIANIFFLLFGGIWTAAAVLVGGALGANQLDEARRRAKWLGSGSCAAGFIIAMPGALLSAILIPLVFSNLSAEARATSIGLVFVILAYMPLWGILNMQFAVSRAGGDTALGMWVDLIVNSFIFIPGAVILSMLTSMPPVLMFGVLKLSDIIKCLLARHLLRRERWVKNLTVSE